MNTRTSNPNRDDYWTCPACYFDMGNVGTGQHTCKDCGKLVNCTIKHEPACHSDIIEGEKNDTEE